MISKSMISLLRFDGRDKDSRGHGQVFLGHDGYQFISHNELYFLVETGIDNVDNVNPRPA